MWRGEWNVGQRVCACRVPVPGLWDVTGTGRARVHLTGRWDPEGGGGLVPLSINSLCSALVAAASHPRGWMVEGGLPPPGTLRRGEY